MIVQQFPIFYQAVTGLYLEAADAGDQTPPVRAEPNTWMWSAPFFLGSATEYTEEPEKGDQTPPLRSEPDPWMWSVRLFQGDVTLDLSQPEAGDFTPPVRDLPEIWMWGLLFYLGSATEYTEQPEAGDQTPLPRHEPELWMWGVPYFLGLATDYTEQPEVGDQTPPDRAEPSIWMWATPPRVWQDAQLDDSVTVAGDTSGDWAFESQQLPMWSLWAPFGSATEYAEAPEAGDFFPHAGAEPNIPMWTTRYFLGDSTVYTENPETGDFVPHPAADPNIWMYAVPFFLGDSTVYTENPPLVTDDGFPYQGALPETWMHLIPFFLGDSTIFTEQPEVGDFFPHQSDGVARWVHEFSSHPAFYGVDAPELSDVAIMPPSGYPTGANYRTHWGTRRGLDPLVEAEQGQLWIGELATAWLSFSMQVGGQLLRARAVQGEAGLRANPDLSLLLQGYNVTIGQVELTLGRSLDEQELDELRHFGIPGL